MKVLLLSPPFVPFYMRNARCDFVSLSGTQWYPLLLGYCGAWLERCGHEVKLVDAPAYHLDYSATRKLVFDWHPDCLVVYTGRLSEDSDVAMADDLTESLGCITVFAGAYASMFPATTLGKSRRVPYLIAGEFELPLQDLLDGKTPDLIPNLVYRGEKDIIQNQQRPYLDTARRNFSKSIWISAGIKPSPNVIRTWIS
jgi:anaerobic magnesium-protoporphyrin IX monomethyl ester cyclase